MGKNQMLVPKKVPRAGNNRPGKASVYIIDNTNETSTCVKPRGRT